MCEGYTLFKVFIIARGQHNLIHIQIRTVNNCIILNCIYLKKIHYMNWIECHAFILAVRARLSGMKIEGRTRSADNFVLLYQDPSNITACTESMYGNEGTSPCDDVLLIPMSNTILFQFIKISVAHYLQLCEVQIFAGKCHFYRYPCFNSSLYSNWKRYYKVFYLLSSAAVDKKCSLYLFTRITQFSKDFSYVYISMISTPIHVSLTILTFNNRVQILNVALHPCCCCIISEVCSLLSFDHGQIVSNGKNIFKSSEQATVTCDSNYAPVYTSITCQSDRSWSPQPSCIAVTCTVPAFLTGQYYLNQKVVAQGAALGFQSVITASCGVGYLPSPDTPRTCQVDGQWSGQSPRCTQIICDTENVRHSAIQHYPTLGIGETADVSYILSLFNLKNGSLQVECTAERKLTWIHQPYFGISIYIIKYELTVSK